MMTVNILKKINETMKTCCCQVRADQFGAKLSRNLLLETMKPTRNCSLRNHSDSLGSVTSRTWERGAVCQIGHSHEGSYSHFQVFNLKPMLFKTSLFA